MITGNVNNAGTDGRVYLGLGGREFRLDSSQDDYERGSWREYVLGRGPVEPNLPPPQIRVTNPTENDPRNGFPIDTAKLSRTPVYIRFEPEGDSPNWNLKLAIVLVYSGEGQFEVAYFPPSDFDNLWLGDPYGKILYLTEEWWRDGEFPLRMGREIAAQVSEAVRGA
jgi:hypothetical protein